MISRKLRSFLRPRGRAVGAAAISHREDIFAEAPFATCHASTLAAAGPALVAAWFGGNREGENDVAIWSAVRGDENWSAPTLVAKGRDQAGRPTPCWNPVLWQSPWGPLELYYKVGPTPETWWGMVTRSEDGGRTWGTPARLPDGILGPIKNKPILLDDRLLCPSSTEHDGWKTHFEWTADRGQTWHRTQSFGGARMQIIQPTLLVHNSGRLQALCRSAQGRVAELWSEDRGETWSAPRLTRLRNPNSGFDGVTLADGRHLLVYNPNARRRTPLVVSLSEDGRTWREIVHLEDGKGEFSYPAIIQRPEGPVEISYTNRRQTITRVTLDPSRI